jgi:tRNA threonylcarbamoyladenosine biosynthesis protein TsaB
MANILCIETATPLVGVAVAVDGRVLGEVRLAKGRRHVEQLAPAVQYLLGELCLAPSALSAVAVGNGPGLFTGLRVGVTTAKLMAQALRIPVITVSSLDLLAYPLQYSNRLIVAVMDARRGEVFHASYRRVPRGLQRVTDYGVAAPRRVAAELEAQAEEAILVGDGALLHADQFYDLTMVELASAAYAHPSTSALAELSHARFAREDFLPPWEVELLYLRKPDAEANWEQMPR